ncbi:MAG: hypothetical protein IT457_23275 [Planctomycetes bacterium]|nr:hypothetical protein [Planctomycetota bacterium]
MTSQVAPIAAEGLLLDSDRPLVAAMNSRWDRAAILLCQEQAAQPPLARRGERRPGQAPAPFTAVLGEIVAASVDERTMAELLAAWVGARGHRGPIHVYCSVTPSVGRTEGELRRAFVGTPIDARTELRGLQRRKSRRAILRSIHDRVSNALLGQRLFVDPCAAPAATGVLRDFCTWDLSRMDPKVRIELDPLLDALAIYAEAAFTADGALR